MTTFHWHVVDSQSFPLQIDGYMELSETGAYDNSSVYTPSDVADIVSYAGAVCSFSCSRSRTPTNVMYALQRGIDVMVEIDTPGHVSYNI